MPDTTFIYALCEPETRTVRYIGKSNTPEIRVKTHVRQSINFRSRLGNWLKRVVRSKQIPSLVILAEVPKCSWEEEERRYISNARMLGMNLVNTTDGGEGVTQTPEVRKKIGDALRGRKQSPARCKQQSEILTGRKLPKAHCLAISRGVLGTRHSPCPKKSGRKNNMFGRCGVASHFFGVKKKNATSKFLGVGWHSSTKHWRVRICNHYLGIFKLEIDAAKAYDKAVRKLYGPTAKTNFPIKRRINKKN